MAFEYFTVCIIQLFRTEQNQAYYNCESIIDIYLRLFTDLVTNNTTDGCTTQCTQRTAIGQYCTA